MKILVAIDGSPCSEAAVKEFAARRWGAETKGRILSVVTVPQPNAPDPFHVVGPMRLKLLEREQVRLRDLVTRTADWLRDNGGQEPASGQRSALFPAKRETTHRRIRAGVERKG
jgi:hypothetical protein